MLPGKIVLYGAKSLVYHNGVLILESNTMVIRH